ncbi:MAG: TetR/AcrR family transcriptional regulator [Trebonia sp.]
MEIVIRSPESRTERSRKAILKAAFDLYQELPYSTVTIEAIAARAGVGKPTIYRRWASKGPVLLAALLEYAPAPGFPDTGNFRDDLRAWVYGVADVLSDPVRGHLYRGLIGAAQHDPDLFDAWNEELYLSVRAPNAARLMAGQAAGDLPAGDIYLIADALVGAIWFRMLVTGRITTHAEADTLIDMILVAPDAD